VVQSKLRDVAARPRLRQLFGRRPPAGAPHPPKRDAPIPSDSDGERPLGRVPQPGRLRRERRALMRRREEGIRDVGGLALEMYRRDRFRPELLLERCADVMSVEERIHELDSILVTAAAAPRGVRGMTRCRCGAPLARGAHFCAHCGRPAPEGHPVVTCSHCGQPLPADTNFCPACGNAVAAEKFAADQEAAPDAAASEATIVTRDQTGDERPGGP
jgi:Double zinc ribbon